MSEAAQPERPEQGPLPSEKIVALRDALEDHRIPYAFGGAVALFYYRDPRSTIDIDVNIFLPPEQRAEVETALGSVYPLDHQQFDEDIGRTGQMRSLWGTTYRPKDWLDIEAVARTRELDQTYITGWLDRFLPAEDPRRTRTKAILG